MHEIGKDADGVSVGVSWGVETEQSGVVLSIQLLSGDTAVARPSIATYAPRRGPGSSHCGGDKALRLLGRLLRHASTL